MSSSPPNFHTPTPWVLAQISLGRPSVFFRMYKVKFSNFHKSLKFNLRTFIWVYFLSVDIFPRDQFWFSSVVVGMQFFCRQSFEFFDVKLFFVVIFHWNEYSCCIEMEKLRFLWKSLYIIKVMYKSSSRKTKRHYCNDQKVAFFQSNVIQYCGRIIICFI